MFRALLCPSSGARDYDVDYHIGRFVLGLLYVRGMMQLPPTYSKPRTKRPVWYQHHSRERLMMGIVMLETC